MGLAIDILLWITYLVSLYFALFWLLVFLETGKFFSKDERRGKYVKKTPIVSVLIPAYNEEKDIIPTLKSLLNLDYPSDRLDVIVIDDGSKDRTKEVVIEFIKDKDNVRLISHENMGKGASLNRGIDIAKGEFFACLDADSAVHIDTLRKMLALYYEVGDSNLAIITPAMLVKKPKTILQKLQRIEYIVAIFIGRLMGYMDCIYVAPGPFSLYRTEIIKKLGGFDEGNLTEDQEIAYRVQTNNYKIRQCYDAFVYTELPGDLKGFYKQRNRWYKGSLFNLLKYKHIIANKKYGDFGMNQTLKNTFAFFLCLTALVTISYYALFPLFVKLYNLSLVNFDFWTYLMTWKLDFSILALDASKIFVVFCLFFITFSFFYYSHKNVDERIAKHGLFSLIPYFIVYYIIKSVIAVIVMVEYSLGKKQKW